MQSQQRGMTKAPHAVDSNLAKLEVDTFAQENAPIKRVVLYKHGIALFERWEFKFNFLSSIKDYSFEYLLIAESWLY